MEDISFCPYRTNWGWSTLQTTRVTQPLVFQGTPDDLKLLAACVKQPEESEKPVDDATPDDGKLFIDISLASIPPSMNASLNNRAYFH